MSATKDALLAVLADHIGIDRGQTVNELVGALAAEGHTSTPRQVRSLVEQLRAEGHHICAHPAHGYWIAANDGELDLSCRFLRARALCSLQQEAAMRRVSVPFLLGQMSLLAQE